MTQPPDFVIAGAAKCGTTALFQYLARHPRIFVPPVKELKFFCTDLQTSGGVHTLNEYRAAFAPAPAGCVTGEVSTLYLYSKVAIANIMALNPRARVIAMLRYPADAAHSLYAAGWSHRLENIDTFEEAWRAQAARLAGERVPPGWPDPATLQYGPMYRFAEQVRRLMEHVPEEQRHIIVYEEFFADPQRHYRRLLEFLQVPSDERSDFPVVNPAMGSRSTGLERLLRQPPAWLKRLYTPVRAGLHALRIHPGRLIWSLNAVASGKPPLSPAFRREIETYYAADIAELEKLLGRPLWRHSVNGWASTATDRRLLEDVILPHYGGDNRIRKVLFVGCASYTQHYQRSHFPTQEYWTLDPAPEQAPFGAERHVVAGIEDVGRHFPPGYFDLIVCNGVYGWGLNELPDCETALFQCHQCLVAGGHLLLGWNDLPGHDPAPLTAIRSLRQFGEYLFPPLGASRYLTATAYRHTYSFYRKSDS